ncbi:YecH family metal-binding protein [Ferrimonas balearica]|uniref:YecH family metal-binding protein n=1 Tax=Ferrimonas balearica TaxID=44012 RepID=UPI001C99B7D3|nr:YecH family metal-binding protein [Ferrimonas balearica]MBY5921976.1 YecH family protein [Ferrimonas balearica]MBY5994684.1 YecH family protein [Ferrimonas balearica]
MSSVHAHEFLAMVADCAEPKTLEQLKEMASARFGAEVRFHTCKAEDLTISALLDFLLARDKLTQVGDGYQVNAARVCNHG